MQTIRSHIQRSQAHEMKVKSIVDLDEKIRQIRKKNKEREKRFKEIEDDKLNALSNNGPHSRLTTSDGGLHDDKMKALLDNVPRSQLTKSDGVLQQGEKLDASLDNGSRCQLTKRNVDDGGQHDEKNEKQPSTALPGVQGSNKVLPAAKGRGQRLMEMSKEPLRAKDFESKAIKDYLEKKAPSGLENDGKSGQQKRKFARRGFTTFTMTCVGDDGADNVHLETTKKCETLQERNDDIFEDCVNNEQDRDTSHPANHEGDKILGELPNTVSELLTIVEPSAVIHPMEAESDSTEELPSTNTNDNDIESKVVNTDALKSETVSSNLNELDPSSDPVKDGNNAEAKSNQAKTNTETVAQATMPNMGTKQNTEQLVEKHKATNKEERPQISVHIPKTASTTSFDEVMAMLSPLDVPSNWGDLDYDENEEQYFDALTF